MAKKSLLIVAAFAGCLASCGQGATRVFDVSCLVAGDQAVLFVPGLLQEKLLDVLDADRPMLPGDQIQVEFAPNGDILSYEVLPAKTLSLTYFWTPGAEKDEVDLIDESKTVKVSDRSLIAEGRPFGRDWDFLAKESGIFDAPYDGELKERTTFYPRYLLEKPRGEIGKMSWPTELKTEGFVYGFVKENTRPENFGFAGIVTEKEASDAYASLYPSFPRYIVEDGAYSVPGCEDMLRIFVGESREEIYVETLRGDGATYQKETIG